MTLAPIFLITSNIIPSAHTHEIYNLKFLEVIKTVYFQKFSPKNQHQLQQQQKQQQKLQQWQPKRQCKLFKETRSVATLKYSPLKLDSETTSITAQLWWAWKPNKADFSSNRSSLRHHATLKHHPTKSQHRAANIWLFTFHSAQCHSALLQCLFWKSYLI